MLLPKACGPDYWLYHDLYAAYYDARRNKRNTTNQLKFELSLEENIYQLFCDIKLRRYQLSSSIAFIVIDPKVREIFAATFRDRVVHHLIYNYIADYWDRRFIYDSYSCRVGKGTHFGIKRVSKFMRQVTHGYTREAWVMKLDIMGYFMGMNKRLMWELNQQVLTDPAAGLTRQQRDVLTYLLPIVIFSDPTTGVIIKGRLSHWDLLPPTKSLFHVPFSRGFPIGNLTSQLFSNIYLHQLDHFVKHRLKVRYYGRYVDDFVMLHEDKGYLLDVKAEVERFLSERLFLKLHPGKVYLQPVKYGVPFVGAWLKHDHIYPGPRLLHHYRNFRHRTVLQHQDEDWARSNASYEGQLVNYDGLV